MSFLHIYGQEQWHSPAHIVGTRDELVKLKLAIEKSLYCPWVEWFSTSDGEGYNLYVIALKEDKWEKQNVPLPYTNTYAGLQRKGDWDLWGLWRSVRKWFGCKP